MRVRALIGLAALGAMLAVAGFAAIGGFIVAPADVAEADDPIESVEPVSVAETKQDRAGPLPVAHAAIIDPLLLTPHPMLATGSRSIQVAAADPVQSTHNPATEVTASVRPVALPPEAKRVVPPPRLEKDGTLTVEQIARIKANLHLTPEQEQHWAPVEAELRGIARQMAADKAAGKPKVTISADTAQRLYWAAGPLIMSLRDDQKQEVRRIARNMGLQQVASLI
jgi:hypothetical protein